MKRFWVTGLIISATIHLQAESIRLAGASTTNECLFWSTCSTPSGDAIVVPFELEGNTGSGSMIVRVYAANTNTPAEGLWIYTYRIFVADMTGDNCVRRLTVPFGPIVTDFDYDGDGQTGDGIFINNRHNNQIIDPGNYSPSSARLLGNRLTLEFEDLCPTPGTSSYFLGIVSSSPPVVNNLAIAASAGEVVVEGLAPAFSHEPALANLRTYISELSSGSINARADRGRERRRATMLRLVTKVERKATRPRGLKPAQRILQKLARHTDGLRKDWVINDPETPENEPADLFELIRQARESLTAGQG